MTSLLIPEIDQSSDLNNVEEKFESNKIQIEDYHMMHIASITAEIPRNRCCNCSGSNSQLCIYFALSLLVKVLIVVSIIQCGAGYFLLIKNNIDTQSNTHTQSSTDKQTPSTFATNNISNENHYLYVPFIFAKSGPISNNSHRTTNNTNLSTNYIIEPNYLFNFVFYQCLPIVIASVIIIAYILFAVKNKKYTRVHSIGITNVIYDLILFSLSFIIFGAVLCMLNYFMLIRIIILLKLNKNLKYFHSKKGSEINQIWSWICNKFLLHKSDSDQHEQSKRIIVLYYYIINKYYEYKHSEKRRERAQEHKCKQWCFPFVFYEGKKETQLWNYKEMITNEVEFNASCKIKLIPNVDIPLNLPIFNCTIKIGEFGSCLYKYDLVFRWIQLYVFNGSIWSNVFIASVIQHVFIFNVFHNDDYRIPNIPISLSEVFIVSDVCLVLLVIYTMYLYKRYNYAFLDCFKFVILNQTFNKKITGSDMNKVVDELTDCYWYYNDKKEIVYILCNIFGENISNIVLQYCYKHCFL
eukprot:476006_1